MEQQKEKSNKRLFKISDLAKDLDIKKSVLRLWEKEFDFCFEGEGELRGYSAKEKKIFITIKDLICKQQLSLDAAKEQLFTEVGAKKIEIPVQEKKVLQEEPLINIEQSVETETFQPAEETTICGQQDETLSPIEEVALSQENVQPLSELAPAEETIIMSGAFLQKEESNKSETIAIEKESIPSADHQIIEPEMILCQTSDPIEQTEIINNPVRMDITESRVIFLAQCAEIKKKLQRVKTLLKDCQV